MMKRAILFSIGLVALAISSQGANIAWVSFHADPGGAPSVNAGNAGLTQAPDIGYTDLLSGAGHAVTRVLSQDVADAAAAATLAAVYNSYDLVIIGRSVNSGHYQQQPEYEMWNQMVTVPMIDMSGYTLRASRLGFTTGDGIPDTSTNIQLNVANPSHPVFAGVTLDGSNTMVSDFAGRVTDAVVGLQRGISVNTNTLSGNGVILATDATVGDTAFGGMLIGEWMPGSAMSTVVPTTLAGHRMVFLSGSREHNGAPTSEIAGFLDLTPAGQAMFLNAVDYMAIPEPTTMALLALGGVALALRRKRA